MNRYRILNAIEAGDITPVHFGTDSEGEACDHVCGHAEMFDAEQVAAFSFRKALEEGA